MATDANWRLDPFTNTIIWKNITGEQQTVALDEEIGRYGFRLDEIPRILTTGNSLTVTEDASGGAQYTEVSFTQAPSAGEYRVDESDATTGFVEFHTSENGNVFNIDYQGGGSITDAVRVANLENKVWNIEISNNCGNFVSNSDTYEDVTNLSVTITTSGNPVRIYLQGADDSNAALSSQDTTFQTSSDYRIIRDSTRVNAVQLNTTDSTGTTAIVTVPPGCMNCVDNVAEGTYTYKMQAKRGITTTQAKVFECILIAETFEEI